MLYEFSTSTQFSIPTQVTSETFPLITLLKEIPVVPSFFMSFVVSGVVTVLSELNNEAKNKELVGIANDAISDGIIIAIIFMDFFIDLKLESIDLNLCHYVTMARVLHG